MADQIEDLWKDVDLEGDYGDEPIKLDLGKGRKGLQHALNLGTLEDWKAWLKSDLVAPYWKELWESCLRLDTVQSLKRGIGLSQVQELMHTGEAGGKRRYSQVFGRDQSSWQVGDHLACFSYWVKNENLKSNQGVFYGRNISDEDMDRAVWALKGVLVEMHSPSQINKPMGGAAIFGTSRGSSLASTAEKRPGSPVAGGRQSKRIKEKAALSFLVADEDEMTKQRLDKELEALEDDFTDEEMANLEEELQKVAGPAGPSSSRDFIKNQNTTSASWMEDVLTPRKKIELGRKSGKYNPSDTYWKIVCINMALHLTKQKEEKSQNNSDDDDDDEEPEADDAWLAKDINNAVFENDLYQSLEDFEIPATVAPTTETLLEINPESVTRLQEQQKWLDNAELQVDCTDEDLSALGIEDPNYPRIPGMVRSCCLKFWQPAAIWKLWRIWADHKTLGGVLADSVGLGKTIETIGFILTVARQKRQQMQANFKVSTKPTLIIVPPHLIEQWASELGNVSNKLKVLIYFGDNRTQGGSSLFIKGRLSRDHDIFRPDYDGRYTVVLTTYQTLEARHGLSAVSQWHKKKYSSQYKPTDRIPSDYPYELRKCFDLVVCDEAHYLRNANSGTSLAVHWLRGSFNLLITATPFFNTRNTDFQGYSRLLLFDRPTPPDMRPEELMSQDKYLLSVDFFRKYIFPQTIDDHTSATRMRVLLKHLMIRRSMASAVPIGSERTIGRDIPPVVRKVFEVPFTQEEGDAYNAYWDKNRKVLTLDTTDPNTPRFKWVMQNLRRLVLGGSWLGFVMLESLVMKIQEKQVVAGEDDIKAFYRTLVKPPETEEEDGLQVAAHQLAGMLKGSPKMRLMIEVLRDQVLLRGEKALIWTFFPGEEVYVHATLRAAGFDALMLHSNLDHKERNDMVNNFNTHRDSYMILIMSYLVNSAGLNLQRFCRNVHLFSVALARAIIEQAIGRVNRVGQTQVVQVFDYRVPDTFQISLNNRASQKALPGVLTDMSSSLASLLEPEKDYVEANKWVLRDGNLMYLEDVDERKKGDITDPDTLLDAIMAELEGAQFDPNKKKKRRNPMTPRKKKTPTKKAAGKKAAGGV
ncbi:hypothetical protein AnigIFM49718_008260 [Aspergillus niger]|nr:hypothetical protein AnigIFM49718_008260 [Aspergillus niger]